MNSKLVIPNLHSIFEQIDTFGLAKYSFKSINIKSRLILSNDSIFEIRSLNINTFIKLHKFRICLKNLSLLNRRITWLSRVSISLQNPFLVSSNIFQISLNKSRIFRNLNLLNFRLIFLNIQNLLFIRYPYKVQR